MKVQTQKTSPVSFEVDFLLQMNLDDQDENVTSGSCATPQSQTNIVFYHHPYRPLRNHVAVLIPVSVSVLETKNLDDHLLWILMPFQFQSFSAIGIHSFYDFEVILNLFSSYRLCLFVHAFRHQKSLSVSFFHSCQVVFVTNHGVFKYWIQVVNFY